MNEIFFESKQIDNKNDLITEIEIEIIFYTSADRGDSGTIVDRSFLISHFKFYVSKEGAEDFCPAEKSSG